MSHFKQLITLAGKGNYPLAKGVLGFLSDNGVPYIKSHINPRLYIDGEPNDEIVLRREIPGSDVLVFQSIESLDLQDQFMWLAGPSMFQYGARSVTAILPFMRYRRQDHPNEEKGEINRNLLLVKHIAGMGVKRVVLCDIHSDITIRNFQNEGVRVWNIEQADIFAPFLESYIVEAKADGRPIYALALDKGSIPRAIETAKRFGIKVAVCFKERLSATETRIVKKPTEIIRLKAEHGDDFIFDDSVLADALVVITEDEVSTAGSAEQMGNHLRSLGVYRSILCFTHAVCVGEWRAHLLKPRAFDVICSANSMEITYDKMTGGEILRVDVAPMIGATLLEVIEDIKRG
jgi:phosphoribosylpyrophosphate synthetase